MRAGRDERGVAYPSPLVILSVIALAMAAIAYFATRDEPAPRDRATTVSQDTPGSASPSPTGSPSSTPSPSESPSESSETKSPTESASPSAEPTDSPSPQSTGVSRGSVKVEIYNRTSITGLAARVGDRARDQGWRVVGTDNWKGGRIPSSTVYYPADLERAAQLLAADLGVERIHLAVEKMRRDRLTVILTSAP